MTTGTLQGPYSWGLDGAGRPADLSRAFGIAAVVAGSLHQRLGEELAGQGRVVDSRKPGVQQAAWQPVNSMYQYLPQSAPKGRGNCKALFYKPSAVTWRLWGSYPHLADRALDKNPCETLWISRKYARFFL